MNSQALRSGIAGVGASLIATALMVALLAPFRTEIGLLNAALLFLLLTVIISALWGRAVGLLAAVLTNLAFNLFFIEPLHSFTVQEPHNAVALGVFLLVSVITGTLLAAAKKGEVHARMLQAETEMALRLSHAMSKQTEPGQALEALCKELISALAAPGASVLQDRGIWTVVASAGDEHAARPPTNEERAAADRALTTKSQQAFGHSGLGGRRGPRIVIPAGRDAAYAHRDRSAVFVPLMLGERVLGVLRLDGPIGESLFQGDPRRLLNVAASEGAVALERLELARVAARAESLREADELKAALLASISHDLKTPLATIKAAVTSILDGRISWSPEDLDAFYRTIDSQADRLDAVISAVLDLNRLESGTVTPDLSVVRATHLLRKASELTSFETQGRRVVVEGSDELRVWVDESLIVQALANLIENSVKYSRPDGAIYLRAEEASGRAILTVEDEGPGIAAEDLPRLFERFYRAPAHSRRVKGSGLGLAIVKGFVELCAGSVQVESDTEGTRFRLDLPAAERIGVA